MPTDLFETRFLDCWIVTGSTGEYSDRSEWPIAVFMTEAKAVELVTQLDAKALELGLKGRSAYDEDEKLAEFNKYFGFEIVSHVDYTGVSFYHTKAIFGG